jgi:hypothetical protein
LAFVPYQAGAREATGTFLQLNPVLAEKSVAAWRSDLVQMRAAGLRTLIIQWSAAGKVSYFKNDLPFEDKFATIERIFEAIGDDPVEVYLGLEHDPNYWMEITAREQTLKDYFLVRVARNLRIQLAMLNAFSARRNWRGYYIPDEIDDKSWRVTGRRKLMRDYLARMTRELRKSDASREVCVSSFFRGRTAPDVYARLLSDLTEETGLDHVLVQDGAGEGDPPLRYVPVYFQALREGWRQGRPDLWCVVEAFQRVDGGKGFKAVPAAPERLREQVTQGRLYFTNLVLFTFSDYADPDLGAEGEAAYKVIQAL